METSDQTGIADDRLRGPHCADGLIIDRRDSIKIDHEVGRLDPDNDVDERPTQLFGGP